MTSTASEPLLKGDDASKTSPLCTASNLRLLLPLYAIVFCNNGLISMIAPFFPNAAKDRFGVDSNTVGFIFSTFPFTMMFAAPFASYLIIRVGPVWILTIGELLLGGATLLFGFAPTNALGLVFLARGLQGFAAAFSGTAVTTILMKSFEDRLPPVMGFLEMITGVAFIVGPVIGSTLYGEDDGEDPNTRYVRPFLVMGCLVAALSIIGPVAVGFSSNATTSATDTGAAQEEEGSGSSDTVSAWTLLSSPRVMLAAFGCLLWTTGGGFLEPTIGQHLIDWLGVSGWKLGLIFVIPACCYAFTAPFVGSLTETVGSPFLILGMGLVILGAAYCGLGPAPIFCPCISDNTVPLTLKYIIQVSAMIVFGIGLAMSSTPTIPAMHAAANAVNGKKDANRLQAVVAGLFQACYSLGDGLGPIVGGNLAYYVNGFPTAAFYFGCLLFGYGVLVLLTCYFCPISASVDLSDELLESGKRESDGEVPRAAPKTPLLRSPLVLTPGAMKKLNDNKDKIIQEKAAESIGKPNFSSRKSL